FSDQYSLAIVYQELLTGQRPYTGSSLRQQVMQHLYSEPGVSSLSAADRPAVARALAKKPEDRYPTCKDFVCALRHTAPAKVPAPAAGQPQANGTATEPTAPPGSDDGEKTQGKLKLRPEAPL